MPKRGLNLSEVGDHFELWRSNREGRRKIPEELIEMIVPLLKDHTISQICQSLRLCGADLKKRLSLLENRSILAPVSIASSIAPLNIVEIDRPLSNRSSLGISCQIRITNENHQSFEMQFSEVNSSSLCEYLHCFLGRKGC